MSTGNLICCIYTDGTRTGTIANRWAALPFTDDPEIREIFFAVLRKPDGMTDAAFSATELESVYPTIFSENQHGL